MLTGVVIGCLLSAANIYTGLKIGWGFNMSIAAALLSIGFWAIMRTAFRTRPWGLLENNVNQAGASAAASISSAGLSSAVPALMLLEPSYEWSWAGLSLWMFCCSSIGVLVAVLFRRQMLLGEHLPFPSGIATAVTLKELYARGSDAISRVKALVAATLLSAAWKIVVHVAPIKKLPIVSTFAFDPSLMQIGAGAIIGFRVSTWIMIGCIIAWGVIAPLLTANGLVAADAKPAVINEWLLWPGVAMLVTSSLTSLAFSGGAFARAFKGGEANRAPTSPYEVSRTTLWVGILALSILTLIVGYELFGLHPLIGLVAVSATMVLAVVALRVAGETNVTPIGPMGKVTQLTFGGLDPGHVTTNLMAASVTAGSSAQAADMMHDLKTGLMLGGSPKAQAVSQMAGVLAGAGAASAFYLFMIESIGPKLIARDPEWQAPAVAQWGAVAKLFRDGVENLQTGATAAMIIAGVLGIIFAIIERKVPKRVKPWVPSPAALGIALIIWPQTALSFFFGAVLGLVLSRWVESWWVRFGIIVASGLVAGESLAGAFIAIAETLSG